MQTCVNPVFPLHPRSAGGFCGFNLCLTGSAIFVPLSNEFSYLLCISWAMFLLEHFGHAATRIIQEIDGRLRGLDITKQGRRVADTYSELLNTFDTLPYIRR